MTESATCPGSIADGGGLYIGALSSYKRGQGAIWQTVAPAGFSIVSATVPSGQLYASGISAGSVGQYGGDFYWNGGRSNISAGETGATIGPFGSNYFGLLLVCGKSPCRITNGSGVGEIGQINLQARETPSPSLSSLTGLWQARGWIRGRWTLAFSGDSPSGMCGLSASFGGLPLPGATSARNRSAWHQCSAPPVSDSVVTQGYAQGPNTLQIAGYDAAGKIVGVDRTIDVDNQPPTVTLSGPADAPSTAGTQYVTATATAGPSGIDGISCSVDGARGQWYKGSSAHVPVSGVGHHAVRCVAENNAVDTRGVHGASAPSTFAMKIGVPTVTAIAFSKLVARLRCRQARKGKTKCQPRTVLRRRSSITVRHGDAATLDGWLGTYTGTALSGQTVQILAAADNGKRNFRPVTTATTAANGTWSAQLPAGPSRLVEAVYAGGPSVQSSVSGLAREVVPAKIELRKVSPRKVAWGHSVKIVGRLLGGYLPPGGALVRLRIGLGKAFTTYGVHEHVGGHGRFTTTYTFGLGDASIHRTYWFQIASLPMGNYPYAPASSRRISVAVGGHPAEPNRAG